MWDLLEDSERSRQIPSEPERPTRTSPALHSVNYVPRVGPPYGLHGGIQRCLLPTRRGFLLNCFGSFIEKIILEGGVPPPQEMNIISL